MVHTVLIYLFVFVALCNAKSTGNGHKKPRAGCSLPYKNFPDKEPVFLNSAYSLIEPNVEAIDLKTNEEILVSCPGARNALLATGNSLEKFKCAKNDVLKIGRDEYDLSELNCSRAVTGEVVETTELCGNKRGTIKTIGHNVADETYDYLFHVCYDDQNGEALYAEHIIYGAAVEMYNGEST